jgi:hypothetical protein
MIKKTAILTIFFLAFLFSACEYDSHTDQMFKQRVTINIEAANQEVKDSVGIDLLNYKSRIDKKFPSDSFYVDFCEDILYNTGKSQIFMEFGQITTFDDGDSISYSKAESLFVLLHHSIGNNINLENCQENHANNFYCKRKKLMNSSYISVNRMYTLSALNTIGDVYLAYNLGLLNYEELSFMVVFHHILNSIYRLDTERFPR